MLKQVVSEKKTAAPNKGPPGKEWQPRPHGGGLHTILGKTEGAIKSLQHRALASLQKQLQKREEPSS